MSGNPAAVGLRRQGSSRVLIYLVFVFALVVVTTASIRGTFVPLFASHVRVPATINLQSQTPLAPALLPGKPTPLKGAIAAKATIQVMTASGLITVTIPQAAKVDGNTVSSNQSFVAHDFHAHGNPPGGTPLQGILAETVSVSVLTKSGVIEVILPAGAKVDGNSRDVHVHED